MDNSATTTKRVIKYVHSEHLLQQADKNPAVKGRASLTHELIRSYGLLSHMQIIPAIACALSDLSTFHSADYLQRLERFCLKPKRHNDEQTNKCTNGHLDVEEEADEDIYCIVERSFNAEMYGLLFECPFWQCMKEYVCAIAGATMIGCASLCESATQPAELVLNWTGGWHRAHPDIAADYCYVNDIVVGILVLCTHFQRVLYVDLDIHHSNDVQGAFETTECVFTLSFHKFECDFYQGTGSVEDCGSFAYGRGYTANFPYKGGITGANFQKYFKRVTNCILDCYQPNVIVIQCGTDVLLGDPLGGTNLTPADLINCIDVLLQRNLPTLLLGGGSCDSLNASRFWTQLTAHLCSQELCEDIPAHNKYFLQYGPDFSLRIPESIRRGDINTLSYLEGCADTIKENLKKYVVKAI